MKSEYVLISSILLLGIGLGLIFGYTHGTVGFSAAYPVAGASFQVSINTTGLPAMVGVPLTALGLLLLIAAAILATIRALPSGRQQADHR
jgi:uncharacterized membrane protein